MTLKFDRPTDFALSPAISDLQAALKARGYKGSAYRANRYDEKQAAAYARLKDEE